MKKNTDYKLLKRLLFEIMSDGLTHQKSHLIKDLRHVIPAKDKERIIRKTIEKINCDYENYPDVLIIGTSDRSGYRLGTNSEDIRRFRDERWKRSMKVGLPVKKANRLIRKMGGFYE